MGVNLSLACGHVIHTFLSEDSSDFLIFTQSLQRCVHDIFLQNVVLV